MRRVTVALLCGMCLVLSLAIVARAQDADLLKRAEELNAEINQLYRQGRYAEAIPKAREALAIREKALGLEHPDVATSLENYAALLGKTNGATEAEAMEDRAKAIRAKRAKENPTK